MISLLHVIVLCATIRESQCLLSGPKSFMKYQYSTELKANIADLHWSVNNDKTEITFELQIKTLGWIALGITGGMKGADIGLGWVDQKGTVHFQDRHAVGEQRPLIDNTSSDWFALNGKEENGWTAIQFKRKLDTCDSLDYPIKLIFAWGLTDPSQNEDISYHEATRRDSRTLSLLSFTSPPDEEKFAKLDYFDFRLHNYAVPANDTTYHCSIHKIPAYAGKRHVIAHKMLIEDKNRDIVHHLLMYECEPTAEFDDNNLPDGDCYDVYPLTELCIGNIATGWAVGGDSIVEFPDKAGYPVGADFPVKYYLISMHYDNKPLTVGRRDSSGMRFYLGEKLRERDIGYLTLGTDSSPMALAIPPNVDQFIVDSYCQATHTKNFPKEGITVISALPHTHLQGVTVWSKLIRNNRVVKYLYNSDAYDFNYQFDNRLTEPIVLYPVS
ncbi:unnamed protein product [Didymodactylos carnosus]|uniref:DOMON domain-containing protein n=1 Tax=Didymodactylos carnosus TaxID=1234261 RepID=A0A814M766_9BILA|nr:unnamed protein product [Didymodactylos carnosus]CAF3839683.1 unnamed protein product [Didymodactylos carnosus]